MSTCLLLFLFTADRDAFAPILADTYYVRDNGAGGLAALFAIPIMPMLACFIFTAINKPKSK